MRSSPRNAWSQFVKQFVATTSRHFLPIVLVAHVLQAFSVPWLRALPRAYPATAVIWVGSLLTLVFGVLNLIVAVAWAPRPTGSEPCVDEVCPISEWQHKIWNTRLGLCVHTTIIHNTGNFVLDFFPATFHHAKDWAMFCHFPCPCCLIGTLWQAAHIKNISNLFPPCQQFIV